MTIEYMRVSVAYRMANGDSRDERACDQATRCPPRRRPANQSSGIRARPHRPDSGPDGHVALAEHVHPAVEQEVVERRVAVVAQRLGDVAERQRGDVDAQRLVEPQRRAGDEPQHDADDQHADHADADPGPVAAPAVGHLGHGVVDRLGEVGGGRVALDTARRR